MMKNWICKNLINVRGELNKTRCSTHARSWMFINHKDKLNEIIESTAFLPNTAFLNIRIYCILNDITQMPKCKYCRVNDVTLHTNRKFLDFCSRKCANIYNCSNKTEHHIVSLRVKTKCRSTIEERYGEDNYFKTEEFRKIMIDKHNRTSGSQMSIPLNTLEKLNDINYLEEQNKIKPITKISKELNVSPSCIEKRFKKFNIEPNFSSRSSGEMELYEFIISSVNIEVIHNDRIILNPYELDIYIPKLNLAFEYDGEYFHKDTKERDHWKNLRCKELGINLIRISDNDWNENKNNLKIYINDLLMC